MLSKALRARIGDLFREEPAPPRRGAKAAKGSTATAATATATATTPAAPAPVRRSAVRERTVLAVPIQEVISGGIVTNEEGSLFVHERLYTDLGERPMPLLRKIAALDRGSYDDDERAADAYRERRRRHRAGLRKKGPRLVRDLPDLVAALDPPERGLFRRFGHRRLLYLDIETCGLSGVPVFLVGLGFVVDRNIVFRQLFARDYGEERALLAEVARVARDFDALVTFNGKTFDTPFLHDRAVHHRVPFALPLPHLDLLWMARRRWKEHLPNCRLQTLEWRVLRRRRGGDVDGAEIPGHYHDFVKRGEPHRLVSVFHHNLLDVVAMVELTPPIFDPEVGVYSSGAGSRGGGVSMTRYPSRPLRRNRFVRRALLTLGAVAASCASAAHAAGAAVPSASPPRARPSLEGQIDSRLRASRAALVEIRRDIHRHPEVSGQETRTAALVAKRLRALGLQVRTGVGGHGVVGILRGGKPGPVVGYRADMDAVPSRDPDPVDFRSIVIGVRHICGHDVHTAVGLGVAEGLAAVKRDLPGTAVFYFQPAEETTEGAEAMIEEGALGTPTPSAIFALHSAPLEAGTIAAIEGMALPGLDAVTIRLSGRGDLGAAAKACVALLRGMESPRQGAPADSFVGVEIWNQGLPDGERSVAVSAGLHAASDSIFARVERAVRAKVAALSLPDVTAEVAYQHEVVPATVNDLEVVRATYPALRRALGRERLTILQRGTRFFSEDFSYFLKRVPGAMYFLGVSNAKKGIAGMPHSPGFAVDETAIDVGARAMARVMADYLARGAAAGRTPKPAGPKR